MKTSDPEHLAFARQYPFSFACDRRLFSPEQYAIIVRWGHWMQALATERVKPLHAGQVAYVVAVIREWPDELPAQAASLSAVLGTLAAPADVATIAGHFEGKKTKKRLEEVTRLLETLKALGRAREIGSQWTSS